MEHHIKASGTRKRKVKNNYCFIILFCVAFIVSIPFVVSSLKGDRETEEGWIDGDEMFTDDFPPMTEEVTRVPTLAPSVTESIITAPSDVLTASPAPAETVHPTPAHVTTVLPQPEKGEFIAVNTGYFNDALFIGDSRTVGIATYGTLKNADYFARVGMTVYNINKNATDVSCSAIL